LSVTDELVADCLEAIADPDRRGAVTAVLERATQHAELVRVLQRDGAGLNVLHSSDALTVINVVWPPRFTLFPHDHRMWAAIGIYSGVEDNAFFRRSSGTITASGGKQLLEGAVLQLGDDVIHSVHNPASAHTGGIHVYGGDFLNAPRSQWDPETLDERPWTVEDAQRAFLEADTAVVSDEPSAS
jgi:predicted metal-dependent enzyme (double-stranded beta helix superfamily)